MGSCPPSRRRDSCNQITQLAGIGDKADPSKSNRFEFWSQPLPPEGSQCLQVNRKLHDRDTPTEMTCVFIIKLAPIK